MTCQKITYNHREDTNMLKKINIFYRKIMFKFSKKDLDAILKYDPLNLLGD